MIDRHPRRDGPYDQFVNESVRQLVDGTVVEPGVAPLVRSAHPGPTLSGALDGDLAPETLRMVRPSATCRRRSQQRVRINSSASSGLVVAVEAQPASPAPVPSAAAQTRSSAEPGPRGAPILDEREVRRQLVASASSLASVVATPAQSPGDDLSLAPAIQTRIG